MASSAEPGVQPRTASGSTRSAFAGTLGVMLVICVGVLAAVFYHLLAAPRRGKPPVATVTVQPPLVRAPATSALQERPDVAERVDRQKPATVTVTIERGNAEAHKTAGTAVHVHTVVPGDTLWRIAKKQVGDPYRYPELARLSNIRNPDLIRPGDVVRIEIRSER